MKFIEFYSVFALLVYSLSNTKGQLSEFNLSSLRSTWSGDVVQLPALSNYALRVKETKLCDDNVQQYSGYIDTSSDQHYFYWFFESRNDPSNDPLILWLNGGPGCSSLGGLMMENGPCKLSASINKTENNPFSWNNIANVVYLDQPLGAGYSYGSGGALTSDQVGDTVHAFLQLFFQRFPKYKNSDFHVMGESYAGHYIPAIGKVINDRNKNPYSTKINLKSIAIGNGITNPLVQRQYRGLMYCNNSYFPISSKPDCDAAIKAWPECQSKLQECLNGNTDICDSINKYCAKAIPDILSNLNLNSYDIRRNCDPDSGGLCYSIINNIEYYFNQNIIKQALGANIDLEYQICNSTLNGQFGNSNNDRSVNFAPYVANLLNDGIRALIYAGDADIVCDWMGNKAWTKALNWTGNFGFNSAPDSLWKPDPISQPLGESCTYKNFSFLRIFGAGHMVPMDQPFSALHMVSTWIKGSSF